MPTIQVRRWKYLAPLGMALQTLFHPEIFRTIKGLCFSCIDFLYASTSIIIEECNPDRTSNEMYNSARRYLSSRTKSSARVAKLFKLKNSIDSTYILGDRQVIVDTYGDIKVRWKAGSQEVSQGQMKIKIHYFVLSYDPKQRDRVQSEYLPYVEEQASLITYQSQQRYLYTNALMVKHSQGGPHWTPVPFFHPSTFNTLAIDPEIKQEILEDLTRFREQKDYYKDAGRSWKRGYLLYGPPGTGKTSLIAAIANELNFDVYDLELMSVQSNTELRLLLTSTSKRSLIIIEDIDCNLELALKKKRKRKSGYCGGDGDDDLWGANKKTDERGDMISLSGVLNFMDGLWSSCEGERLMIFTTNNIEKLDPALTRPGRMDKHVLLSYCQFAAFKKLVNNYLGIDDHQLMPEVEAILPTIQITPAEVAEVFMGCNNQSDAAMKKLVEEMKKRRAQATSPVKRRKKEVNY